MHHCFRRCALVLLAAVFGIWKAAGAAESVPIGQNVGRLAFKDIRYLRRSLADFADKKAFVIVCTNSTCPLVQRYLPVLQRLDEQYGNQGVQFLSLNVGPGDSIREMAAHAVRLDVRFPTVKDIDGQSVRSLGVTRTPETVVLDAKYALRYRGRIDNQLRLGGTTTAATENNLADAIEAVLAGQNVRIAETPVDGCAITAGKPVNSGKHLTYGGDVAPIVRKHCVACHQPKTEAPFPLLTYDDVSAQGEAIAEVVTDQSMPPWFASAVADDFINHRGLSDEERETVVAWVRSGMARGDSSAESPPLPLKSVEQGGWLIGKPDIVLTAPETDTIAPTGYLKYKYVILPRVFLQDTWVDKIQILPDNPKVVHHCNLIAVPLSGDKKDAKFVTGKVPGGIPMELKDGVAFRIPKNYLLMLQIHYTTIGTEEKCRLSAGLRFARGKVRKELRLMQIVNHTFAIAPGDPHYKVSDIREVDQDIVGEGLFSHMHLRGKDMTFLAHNPDGRTETLLLVPNYNFGWQIGYQWPTGARKFPKGTKFEVIAHFDNSPFNPYNPDPQQTVKEGDQSYEEMMYGFFFYTVDRENLNLIIDPKTGAAITDANGIESAVAPVR